MWTEARSALDNVETFRGCFLFLTLIFVCVCVKGYKWSTSNFLKKICKCANSNAMVDKQLTVCHAPSMSQTDTQGVFKFLNGMHSAFKPVRCRPICSNMRRLEQQLHRTYINLTKLSFQNRAKKFLCVNLVKPRQFHNINHVVKPFSLARRLCAL